MQTTLPLLTSVALWVKGEVMGLKLIKCVCNLPIGGEKLKKYVRQTLSWYD